MGFGDIHGRARADVSSPQAFGECDECGEWFNRVDLRKQMEYSGTRQFWTGFLVCQHCLSEPQPQFLTPILPGDPKPVIQPRPDAPSLNFGLQGFTLFTIVPAILAQAPPPPVQEQPPPAQPAGQLDYSKEEQSGWLGQVGP